MAVPTSDLWDALPSVSRLRSRPIVSFIASGSIWEIGWNGVWVKAWSGPAPVCAGEAVVAEAG